MFLAVYVSLGGCGRETDDREAPYTYACSSAGTEKPSDALETNAFLLSSKDAKWSKTFINHDAALLAGLGLESSLLNRPHLSGIRVRII